MVRDDDLRQTLLARLQGFPVRYANVGENHHAAVAVPLVATGFGADLPGLPLGERWTDDAALLLTRRSARLRNHPGQWAFPGGRLDSGESVEACALREMHEEIGLSVEPAAVLGRLDDFVTRSGFVISPVVVWAGDARGVQPNPEEVASVHRIPVTEFMRPDAPILETSGSSPHPVLRMPVGRDHIAAPTAAVIYQFAEVCLRGLHTRVAHFEQPEFAWR
ncbi:MAG: CoA pyrophosphatase [Pseudomonadales bacterium]